MKVLIVDDSAFMRKALSEVISSDPEMEVVGTARTGLEGVSKSLTLAPDVVTLDIEMPELDGLSALKRILSECNPPPAVIMCSSLTSKGSDEALKALRIGACDFICKEGGSYYNDMNKMREEVLAKVRVAGQSRRGSKPKRARTPGAAFPPPVAPEAMLPPTNDDKPIDLSSKRFDAILIGSSTGGPPVLERMLARLPKNMPMPIVIAQHMPLLFTQSMSRRLKELTQLDVLHAENGMPLIQGKCYVLPGGQHGRVHTRAGTLPTIEVSPDPANAPYKPSVTELFTSGAKAMGKRCLAVVVTGMGDDGCPGAVLIKAAGGMVISQSQATSAVWGMPRAVALANATDAMLSPESLGDTLASLGRAKREGLAA